jgi:hypothetical protein
VDDVICSLVFTARTGLSKLLLLMSTLNGSKNVDISNPDDIIYPTFDALIDPAVEPLNMLDKSVFSIKYPELVAFVPARNI